MPTFDTLVTATPKEARHYPLVVTLDDGCELQVHGKGHELGWTIALPQGMVVICPHGEKVELGTGSVDDVLKGVESCQHSA